MFDDDYDYEEEYQICDVADIDDEVDEDENALWVDEESSEGEGDDPRAKP